MHFKILKMIATSGFLTALECTKSIFGRGYAPDPAGGAYSDSPDPLAGFKPLAPRDSQKRKVAVFVKNLSNNM